MNIKTPPNPFRAATEAVGAFVRNVTIGLEALKEHTSPADLF